MATAGSQSRREIQLSAWGPRGAAAAVRWRGADFRHCPDTSQFCSMLTTLWVMLIHGISLFPSSVPTSSLALPVPRVTSRGFSVCHSTDPRQWNTKGLSCSFLWDNGETIEQGGSSLLYGHSKLDTVKTSSAGCQSKHLWQGLRPYQDSPSFHLLILLYAEIDYFEPVKLLKLNLFFLKVLKFSKLEGISSHHMLSLLVDASNQSK